MPKAQAPVRRLAVAPGNRLLRGAVRFWLRLVFRRIRLLHAGVLPDSGAAMLAVCHPASFLDALILATAFERPVRCLLDTSHLRGSVRGWLARSVGVIPYQPDEEGWRAALQAVGEVLARGEGLAVFADEQAAKSGEPPAFALTASAIALKFESCLSGRFGLAVFPVHLFLPIARAQAGELLIYIDAPVSMHEHLASGGEDFATQVRRLAAMLEQRFRQNAFRLQPGDVEEFLADLEEVLRLDLEEDWKERPDWKQKAGGFTLSQFVVEWVEHLNYLNPGRLVALRDYLNRYREECRRWSLRQFEVEAGGAWLRSPLRRVWCWVESVVGLPIAAYGLINHLLVGLVLFWSGLLRKDGARDQRRQWLRRALVLFGCYVGQVLLCVHWLGRAAAGYYLPTLPVSGAYLWRYKWLWRHRTRFLLLSVGLARRATKLRRMRKQFLEELDAARNAYADMLGVPR